MNTVRVKSAAAWTVAVAAAVVASAAAASATYQVRAERRDLAQYPPRGRLVVADGGQRHVWIMGDGPVTVVCIPGLGGTAADWAHIARELEGDARVVLYDRAGLGWSDPPPRRGRTLDHMVEEVRAILDVAGLAGPYVFVGHSAGALAARLYAIRHPEDVVGVVLVDSSHERMHEMIDPFDRPHWYQVSGTYEWWGAALRNRLRWLGVRRLLYDLGRRPNLRDEALPSDLVEPGTLMALSSRHRRGVEAEYLGLPRGMAAMRSETRSLGDLPLVVITGGPGKPGPASRAGFYSVWQELQADLVAQSTLARQVLAEHTGHHVHRDDPDLVIRTVRQEIRGLST